MSFDPLRTPAQYRVVDGVRERLCTGCGQWLEHSLRGFYRSTRKPSGLTAQCRACILATSRARSRRRQADRKQAREYQRAAIAGDLPAS